MWNREGQHITGQYLGSYLVSGTVINSRVKYGGSVCHMIELDRKINLFGTERDILTLDEEEILDKVAA